MVSVTPLRTAIRDACFCHWPVDPDALARAVPDWLTVESVDGDAWVSAIAHTVERVETFGVSMTRPAPAVNVRTYVRGPSDQRGVYFFALFTDDRFTSETAARLLRLPYRHGRLTVDRRDDGTIQRRLDLAGQPALDVTYTPSGERGTPTPPDSLAGFLVERDRYFASGALGLRLSGSVGHDPWRLAPVDATVYGPLLEILDLPRPLGDPLVHYSRGLDIALAPPTPVVG